MSVTTARIVTDHELFRVVSFATWEARESPETTRHRLQRLEGELKRLGWMPASKKLPDRIQAAGWKRRLWGDDDLKERDDGWLERLAGISYPEELLVYVGLLRREERTEENWEDWVRSTTARWEARHPEASHWATAFARPEREEHDDRPRIYGQGWVWTGEWDGPPEPEGWEGFGDRVYGPGRFSLFPWGLLGYADDPQRLPDGLPRFDLHTTSEPTRQLARDQFLYWELPRLLTCFLKADQFLRNRVRTALATLEGPRRRLWELSERDVQFDDEALGATTRRTRARINELTKNLYVFAELVTSVEIDARSLALGLEEVRRALPASEAPGSARPWPVDRLELSARQVGADLDYARMTMAVADRLLQKYGILGEIEETRAAERLAKLGMIVGAMLGGMQLTPVVTYRSWLFAAGAVACAILYRDEIARFWKNWSRRRDVPGASS